MEVKRDQLIEGLKPMIRELVELVRSFESCLEQSQSMGQLHVESATAAIRLLIPLQTKLMAIVEDTCGDLGEFGVKMTGFVSYRFKASVNSLVESIKKCISGGDLTPFATEMESFRTHPKTLVELIKSSNQIYDELAKRDKLYNDTSDATTKPAEKHLPKLVLVVTESDDYKTKLNMIGGIQTYFDLKEITKGVSFVKVRRQEKMFIQTNEKEITEILFKASIDDFPNLPAFVFIYKGTYYWFRNTVFKTQSIYNWMDDIMNELAYITGIIPFNKIPETVKYFWKKYEKKKLNPLVRVL